MLKAFNRRIQASQRHIKHLSVASKRTLQQPLRKELNDPVASRVSKAYAMLPSEVCFQCLTQLG